MRGTGDRADRIERSHRAEPAIIVQVKVAIGAVGIVPRDHEHGETLTGQPAHQRIVRAEIEDVVFHDPRRHDQHWLGPHPFGRRRILDQLHQFVARDHFAGRHGNIATGLERFGPGRRIARHRAAHIIEEMLRPFDQAMAAGVDNALLQHGIGGDEIGRRGHVEDLPRGEFDHRLVMRRNPAHPRGRRVPPLLMQQEGLRNRVERLLAPCRIGKAAILRQRLDRGRGRRPVGAPV